MQQIAKLFLAAFGLVGLASADINMTECFSSAPNRFGSPSWDGYLTNAIAGIQNGCAATGDSSQATYYASGTQFTPGQLIVTDYNSWDGLVNPGGAFLNELGNRLHDGLRVDGTNGTKISLSELRFNMSSSDPGNELAFAGGFNGTDVYNSARVGIIHGVSDTFITSGSATQLVDELIYVGIGNAFCSGQPGHCGGGPFQSIGD